MDLITIVVPVYNVERYLSACIESILLQTYRNLQILLVNDGSTDSCPQICDEYALKDKRIEVIHKSNGGLSDARNFGIEHSRGQYITFVDSDDVIASDMVEYLYRLLKRNHADISVCQPLRIAENGSLKDRKEPLFKDFVVSGNLVCFHEFMSRQNIGTIACGKLYKIDLFKDVRYPIGRYHEDVFTTYKLVALCETIAVGGEKKYGYRFRNDSIMNSSFSKKHLDLLNGTIQKEKFVAINYPHEINFAQSSIIYALNQCLLRMGRACFYDESYCNLFQLNYRKYEWAYLRYSNARILSKVFSIFAFINVKAVLKLLCFMKMNYNKLN